MDFDNIENIDMRELEKQRYEAIKKSDKYIELNILIGAEKEFSKDGYLCRMPIVTTVINGGGPEEIGCMYGTLKSLVELFEKEYPMECLFSKLTTKISYLRSTDYDLNNSKDDKDDNKGEK